MLYQCTYSRLTLALAIMGFKISRKTKNKKTTPRIIIAIPITASVTKDAKIHLVVLVVIDSKSYHAGTGTKSHLRLYTFNPCHGSNKATRENPFFRETCIVMS